MSIFLLVAKIALGFAAAWAAVLLWAVATWQ